MVPKDSVETREMPENGSPYDAGHGSAVRQSGVMSSILVSRSARHTRGANTHRVTTEMES